jgi:hypothetical protein
MGEIGMSQSSSPVSFLSHRQAEFALVADLGRLRAAATSMALDDLARGIEHARSSVAEHRFSIAVVGEFNRGKSTFINALLGKEILPADIAPTSATINRVTYGLKSTVRVVFKDGAGEESVDIGKLAEYVTKLTPEAEAIASKVEEAIVYYPVPFCKNNVDIVDTPGLNDDVAMTEVTLSVLPRVDAAILVVMATAPFSQTEAAFLEKLLVEYGLGSVLFVVTAIDRLRRQSEREQIVDTVKERITDYIRQYAVRRLGEGTAACADYLRRVGEPRVFGVSGYDGLAGKMEGDEAKLAASRFPEFEAFLERFLTEESGLVVLKTHAERIAGFAGSLGREAASRLASPALADYGPAEESLGELLGRLEWLAMDAKNRLDEQCREAQTNMRSLLHASPPGLLEAAGIALAAVNLVADDLEPPRLSAYVKEWDGRLTEALNAAARRRAVELLPALKLRIEQAVSVLVRFALVFDRVMLHVRSAAPPHGEASAYRAHPAPMMESLAFTAGFDSTETSGAVQRLFDAHTEERRKGLAEVFAMMDGWAAGIEIQPMAATGPKFTKKAVDVFRIEKFKIDLKARFTERISQHLQATWTAREQRLHRQVAETFAAPARKIDQAMDEIRSQRDQLQGDRQRRIAWHEHERLRLEQMDTEIRGIHERARVLSKELHALHFKVLPKALSGRAGET